MGKRIDFTNKDGYVQLTTIEKTLYNVLIYKGKKTFKEKYTK